ncbi:MAG: hypothetical protein IJ019_02420 [Alphaproteobacteria bacterium]|nr:hypothetical protein [Alphaproteobacteria bacterium]
MAKGIFSFLFSDTGAETGARQGGKGDASLVSMGEAEASVQVKLSKDNGLVKGKDNDTPEKKVVKSEKHNSKNVKSVYTPNKKANIRRKNMQKTVRTRTLELNDNDKEVRNKFKTAKNSTLNKTAKIKTVKDFLQHLPPETQDLIKKQIKQKIQPQEKQSKVNNKNTKKQETLSKRELLERKRGIYREEQTALRLAKLAAEKARNMVKAFKNKILGKKSLPAFDSQSQKGIASDTRNNTLRAKQQQRARQ